MAAGLNQFLQRTQRGMITSASFNTTLYHLFSTQHDHLHHEQAFINHTIPSPLLFSLSLTVITSLHALSPSDLKKKERESSLAPLPYSPFTPYDHKDLDTKYGHERTIEEYPISFCIYFILLFFFIFVSSLISSLCSLTNICKSLKGWKWI